ncbi:hypothetical protein BCV72DRAFT_49691 [Rhizopus microsporus var. microsporus]|uniref:C2H2-type domain-containing protein n=1 Tax=Rhizopus microsporus var. microsporus TaxID=86635 RepID=A0A1X0QRR6_RHIZD|nr:hypothetical protein BCV72DRAFT_49691 [Rhizopus microsporus var. microsporus]
MKSLSKQDNWPLHDYHEKYIMKTLSLRALQCNYSSAINTITITTNTNNNNNNNNNNNTNHIILNDNNDSHRLLTDREKQYLRCSICQRRFHSEGNLFNHMQLYHYSLLSVKQ